MDPARAEFGGGPPDEPRLRRVHGEDAPCAHHGRTPPCSDAIIAAGVGTGFGLKALSQSNEFNNNPTTQLADDGENNALVADMMFGVAITFGVTSAVLFLSSDSTKQSKAAPTPAPAPQAKKKSVTVVPEGDVS